MKREGGTMWTLCPGDAGDGLMQPRVHQGSHIWWDDAGSLATATGSWGSPWVSGDTELHGVAPGRCEEQECSCIGLYLHMGPEYPALTFQ